MMASTSALPFSLFPSISERPYHYRKKTIAVRPPLYSSSSYGLPTQNPKSYIVRSSSVTGIPSSFAAMGLFKEKDRSTREPDTLPPQTPGPSNERPTVHGRFMMTTLRKVKRQKSLASVLSVLANDSSSSSPPTTSDPSSSGPASPVLVSSPVEVKDMIIEGLAADKEGETAERFPERNQFRRRHGTTLHPYPRDAPYMQAYDPVLLDNDRYNECLLRRLTLNTPSFRDYNKKPPSNVLDLGCGEGRWVLETAAAWRGHGTKVTGFDLVDVLCDTWDDEKATENVKFVRGNFVKYDLPFLDNSFDLVRMANLSLCIPYDRWEFVLREVKRVLSQDGRLELIDDHIFFPYAKPPVQPPITPLTPFTCRPVPSGSFFDADEDDEDEEEGQESDSTDMEDIDSTPTSVESDPEACPHDKPGPYPIPLPDPYAEWETQQTSSKCLEILYGRMLEQKYGIHSRPSEFIRGLLARVFGKRSVNKVTSLHLSLALPGESGDRDKEEDRASLKSSHSSASSSLGHAHGKKAWISIEWDKKEKKGESCSSGEMSSPTLPASPVPASISMKAAARLGITSVSESMSTKAASRLGVTSPRPQLFTPRNQTPGLILWPSTFISMSPFELEMHVCRHMHVLLGCKAALAEFIATFMDENDKRLVGDEEFNNMLWDYECFRRQRFNWPSDVPEIGFEEFTEPPPKSSASRVSDSSRSFGPVKYRRDELKHVRTIRVYEAFKIVDEVIG